MGRRRQDPAADLSRAVAAALDACGVHGAIVVATSGGPDSTALLATLARRPELTVVAAHVHHGIRGPDADADAAFVTDLAARLGVLAVVERLTPADLAAAGHNFEAAARRLRYAALARVAAARGAAWVATGHTRDDQAETVLFRLLRGSGLAGLRGIAPARGLGPGVRLVRPLLAVARAAVLAHLSAAGLPWRHDRTNDDTRLARNRLRHIVLPMLTREGHPRAAERLARLADLASRWNRRLSAAARRLLAVAERPRVGALVILAAAPLAAAPADLAAEAWRCVWQREGWPTGRMSTRKWNALAALAQGTSGAAIDLPGGLRAARRLAVVRVGPVI